MPFLCHTAPANDGRRLARRRMLAVAALVWLAAVAPGGSTTPDASAADKPTTATLTRRVTLSGSKTAYVRVRVPKGVKFVNPGLYPKSFATGKGRYLGFVLTDDKRGGVRIQGGQQTGSKFGPYAFVIQGAKGAAKVPLPAGDYRLYLLADGAPATITLRFEGLRGTSTLRPSHRVPYVLTQPEVFISPAGNLAVAGTERTLKRRGLAFDILTDVNAQFLASNTTLCFYSAEPPPPPVGYGPGCPGGDPAPVTNIDPGVGGTSGAAFSGIADLPAGRYGLGFNRVAAGVTDSLRYNAGFLTFDAAKRVAPPPDPERDSAGPGSDNREIGVEQPMGEGQADTPGGPAPRRSATALPATGSPQGLTLMGAVVAVVGLLGLVRPRRQAMLRG